MTPAWPDKKALTTWQQVQRAIQMYRRYMITVLDRDIEELSIYPDLDNLVIGNKASLVGLTDQQSFTMLAHWLGAGGNVMLGGDMTQIERRQLQWLQAGTVLAVRDFCSKFPLVPQRGNDDMERGFQGMAWRAGPDPSTGRMVYLFANYGPEDDGDLLKPGNPDDEELREEINATLTLPDGCWEYTRVDRNKVDKTTRFQGGELKIRVGPSESVMYLIDRC